MSRNNRRFVFRRLLAAILAGLLCGPALGTAASAAERTLSFAVAGVIAEVLVSSGDRVEAGTPLAMLDTSLFEARRKALAAERAAADAELDLAEQRHVYAREQFDALAISKMELDEAAIVLANAMAKAAKKAARLLAVTWRLERTTLRAPAAGEVLKVPGYAGMVVNPRVDIVPVVVLRTSR